MSKISYHPKYRNHLAVKKLKAGFLKVIKECNSYEPSCYVKLTGVADDDMFFLDYHISDEYKSLHNKIGLEIKEIAYLL